MEIKDILEKTGVAVALQVLPVLSDQSKVARFNRELYECSKGIVERLELRPFEDDAYSTFITGWFEIYDQIKRNQLQIERSTKEGKRHLLDARNDKEIKDAHILYDKRVLYLFKKFFN